MSEAEAAGNFRWRLMAGEPHLLDSGRIDGFFYCMSGANGAEARRAHQRSRAKMIQSGDLVVCHCNSYVDGYWTDITRTYCMGSPNDKQRKMYEAVGAVREIVLGAIRPGVRAAEVDHAARQTMGALGFGEAFSTPLGHGVGFGAIDHTARPVLHPASEDVLEEGQVFNVEPGIYLEGEAGKGGMRHCDLVAVTRQGVEQLTPFHTEMREWVR
jgi:Xaa-Pro aminopeptidase